MTFPTSTAFFAALFGLVYAGLTCWVVVGRVGKDVMHGDGGDDGLQRRIRAHANFIEYVPIILLLLAFFEASGGGVLLTRILLAVLLVARLAHPVGMLAPKDSPRQYAFRGVPFIATTLVLIISAIGLLVRVI